MIKKGMAEDAQMEENAISEKGADCYPASPHAYWVITSGSHIFLQK